MVTQSSKPLVAIVQARMSSSRLPGKVLFPLSGLPMVHQIHNALLRSKFIDTIVIATSDETSDDILFQYCVDNGLNVFRGSLEDVLGRFLEITRIHNSDYFVRVTADCPLICVEYIDKQFPISLWR